MTTEQRKLERDRRIVELAHQDDPMLSYQDISEIIADEFGDSITRQRVQQIVKRAGVPPRRMLQMNREKALRQEADWLRDRLEKIELELGAADE